MENDIFRQHYTPVTVTRRDLGSKALNGKPLSYLPIYEKKTNVGLSLKSDVSKASYLYQSSSHLEPCRVDVFLSQ